MDKLRAIELFVAAAEEKSFSAAARRLDVSVPAVAKMINALENNLGSRLFDRHSKGLALTADGTKYLEACSPLLEQLALADEAVTGAASRARGTLVVGTMAQLALHCIVPALPAFHQRHPDIQLDLRVINRVNDPEANAADLFIVMGWPEAGDLVHRRIAETRQQVCATPEYWMRHGVPHHPSELERHNCLCFRNPQGTVIDLWRFSRDGDEVSVAVGGWLSSNHRDANLELVLAGEGVARLSDLSVQAHLASGRLVTVLGDWEMRDAPPINLLTRSSHRRTARVRAFADFVTAMFRDLEAASGRAGTRPRAERPEWYGRRFGHVSAAMGRKRPMG